MKWWLWTTNLNQFFTHNIFFTKVKNLLWRTPLCKKRLLRVLNEAVTKSELIYFFRANINRLLTQKMALRSVLLTQDLEGDRGRRKCWDGVVRGIIKRRRRLWRRWDAYEQRSSIVPYAFLSWFSHLTLKNIRTRLSWSDEASICCIHTLSIFFFFNSQIKKHFSIDCVQPITNDQHFLNYWNIFISQIVSLL